MGRGDCTDGWCRLTRRFVFSSPMFLPIKFFRFSVALMSFGGFMALYLFASDGWCLLRTGPISPQRDVEVKSSLFTMASISANLKVLCLLPLLGSFIISGDVGLVFHPHPLEVISITRSMSRCDVVFLAIFPIAEHYTVFPLVIPHGLRDFAEQMVDLQSWDLSMKQRPPRKPPWIYWAEMEFEMVMVPYLQEGIRRKHNTSHRSFFLCNRETDDLPTTSKSRQQLKVMLKAFWSLSYMLLAINIKYMKGGPIRYSLIARKAYVQQAGLTHSIIEATASHICENRLYPFSLSLLYERICVLNIVYFNDVLLCY